MKIQYKGIIVEESLEDNRLLNSVEIVGFRISKDENPEDRWHLYTVMVSRDDIKKLAGFIKTKWYMHFWNNKHIIAVFKEKLFEFNYNDKAMQGTPFFRH